jgi:hypothetical protein
MKLSKETLSVLQSFTSINPSILVEAGNVLRTVDPSKTVLAKATITEEFPIGFAIYDLPNFLQVLKMFEGADIEFNEKFCIVRYADSPTVVRYMFASPDTIETVKKDITMPSTEVNFTISKSQFGDVIKAATTMGLNHLVITKNDEKSVNLTVTDIDNSQSNNFNIANDAELEIDSFDVVFEMSKLTNILAGQYNVGISSKNISHFFGEGGNIQYWIALHVQSKFNSK